MVRCRRQAAALLHYYICPKSSSWYLEEISCSLDSPGNMFFLDRAGTMSEGIFFRPPGNESDGPNTASSLWPSGSIRPSSSVPTADRIYSIYGTLCLKSRDGSAGSETDETGETSADALRRLGYEVKEQGNWKYSEG